jgi:hypothetical protein
MVQPLKKEGWLDVIKRSCAVVPIISVEGLKMASDAAGVRMILEWQVCNDHGIPLTHHLNEHWKTDIIIASLRCIVETRPPWTFKGLECSMLSLFLLAVAHQMVVTNPSR